MVAVVVMGSVHDLRIEAHRRNQPNKSKLRITVYTFNLNILINSCTQATRQIASVIKVGGWTWVLCAYYVFK